ncbi:hypothetical protein PR202_gb19706 [Eleusine coracana subsp. coracana]|uniref:Endoplasmic reticulum vesicle transporter protein n=1 Tax=Eleusine coracana subsp. coracana TaxID=191504 RepID=A0AAV5FAK9_ELECO|nr:hypothetical protein PR202_gb19706 [Eleusine coracana subsp. coracana]
MELWSKLRNLDAYPKVNEDFYSRTLSGGLITIISSLAILLLFFSEIRLYLYSATESKLTVDTSRGERLHINLLQFDITFPALPCSLVAVDTMDVSGEQHYDIRHDIIKKRIDHLGNVIESRKDGVGSPKVCGPTFSFTVISFAICAPILGASDIINYGSMEMKSNIASIKNMKPLSTNIERPLQKHGGRLDHNEVYCGSCYGSEESDDQCCNTCEEVRDAYRKKGWALTNVELIDQVLRPILFPSSHFNISHKINKLSFGKEFPGVVNPLDGVEWIQDHSNGLTGMYQYFVKVVPTIYTDIRGRKINSNQFSVTEHFREAIGYPRPPSGVYFFYEFSPIKVDFTEENTSLLHFLTNICAIVGGIFTVAGIIDSFVYHGHRAIKKKMEIGKLG